MARIPIDIIRKALRGDMDSEDRKVFDEWILSPGNRKTYNALKRLRDSVRYEESLYEPDGEALWHRLNRRVSANRKKIWKVAIAASLSGIILGISISLTLLDLKNKGVAEVISVESFSGKTKTLLPDGSAVWLHEHSSLCYDRKLFGKKNRSVTLDGEAYFEVKSDAGKPFSVSSGGLDITVTGTKFNVKDTESTIDVSLTEGSVCLSAQSGASACLISGQSARYVKTSGKLSVSEDDVYCNACWANSSLEFKEQTLGEICRYLSVWYRKEIEVDCSLESKFAYTFTVTDEPIEEILRLIAEINGLEYGVRDEEVFFIRKCR